MPVDQDFSYVCKVSAKAGSDEATAFLSHVLTYAAIILQRKFQVLELWWLRYRSQCITAWMFLYSSLIHYCVQLKSPSSRLA